MFSLGDIFREFAPYARTATFVMAILVLIAFQISTLKVRSINIALIVGTVSYAVLLGLSTVFLYSTDETALITKSYSAGGVLLIWGIIWPALLLLFAVSIADENMRRRTD